MSTRLLTLKEVAERTGIPVSSLYPALAPKGDLACFRSSVGPGPKHRTRGRIRVKESDLEAWIDRHRTAPVVVEELSARGRSRPPHEPATGRYA